MFTFYKGNLTNEVEFLTGYLTKDDKHSIVDTVEKLNKAVTAGNSKKIVELARSIVNEEKRNEKINRHETVINSIIELLTAEMNIGEYTKVLEVAEVIKNVHPEWCEKDQYRHPCLPIGAVASAFNRLIATGNYVLIHANNTRYFKRIG